MKNNILGVVSVSFAVLLAACGQSSEVTGGNPSPGGNGSGGTIAPVARSAVSLSSKEDALRQLRVSSLVASQVAGGNINLGSAKKRAQPLAWNFGHGERAAVGGSSGQHSFQLLQGAQPGVDRGIVTHANAVTSWPTANGATEKLTLNGVTEQGLSADQSVSFQRHGTDQAAYSESRERRSSGGAVLASETLQLQGLSEVSWPSGGTLDARGLLKYRFKREDGQFFNVDIGENGTPFTVLQNEALSYAGNYAYELPGEGSGLASVATVEPIAFDASGDHPASGVLRIVSGDRTAIFNFRPDGGATLEINQSQQEITAAEIRNALLGS